MYVAYVWSVYVVVSISHSVKKKFSDNFRGMRKFDILIFELMPIWTLTIVNMEIA